MINLMRRESFERANKVKLIIMDVDGTLTDGSIFIGAGGELFKQFHCRDGFGITLAKRAGIKIALITGRTSEQLLVRARELKIDEDAIWQGDIDKREAYVEVKNKFHLKDEDIAYIGDDILDLPIMMQVGFTGTVNNAVNEVKTRVCVVSDYNGGQGAVREIIEFILKAKGLWNGIVADYLSTDMVRINPFRPSINPLAAQNQLNNQQNQLKQQSQLNQQNQLNNPLKQTSQPVQNRLTTPTPSARPAATQQAKSDTPVFAQRPPVKRPTATPPASTSASTAKPASEPTELEKLEQIGNKYKFKF